MPDPVPLSDNPEALKAPSLNQLAVAGRSVLTHLQSTHGSTVNASIITRVFLPLAREQFPDCIEIKLAPSSEVTTPSSSTPSLNELPSMIERVGRFTDPNSHMQTYLDNYFMELALVDEDIKVYVRNKLREPLDPGNDYQIVETEEKGQYFSTRWELPLRVVLAVVIATHEDIYTDKWDNDIIAIQNSSDNKTLQDKRIAGRDKRIEAMHEINRRLMQMGLCHKDVTNTWLQSTIGHASVTLDMEDHNALLKYIREYLVNLPILQQALISVQGFRTVLLPWLRTGIMSKSMQDALISNDDNIAHHLQSYVKARYLSELGIDTNRKHHKWHAERIATYCHRSGLIDIECDFTPWLAEMTRWFAKSATQDAQAKARFQQLSPSIIAWLETDYVPTPLTQATPSSSSTPSSPSSHNDNALLNSEAQFYLISRLFDTWDIVDKNRHLFAVAFDKSAFLLNYFSQLKQETEQQVLIEGLKTGHGWETLRDNLERFRQDYTKIRKATEKDFIEHFWANWYAANTPNENEHYDVIDCAKLAYTLAELKYRDEGYQFVLGLPSNDAIERGKIYFEATQNGQVTYKVIAPDSQIVTATLDIHMKRPWLPHELLAMKYSILTETSKRNHTQIKSDESRVIELSPTQLDGILIQIQKAHAIITDASASTQQPQDDVITLDVYQVNRLFLHAMTTPVLQWTDALALTLKQVMTFIESDFSYAGIVLWNQQALRQYSYPPDLLEKLNLNIYAYDAQRRGVQDSATVTPRELFLWQDSAELLFHIIYTPDANPEVTEWLLNKALYLCYDKCEKISLFLTACQHGHLGLVNAFIKRGFPLHLDGLKLAAEQGHFKVVIRLLKAGMIINNNNATSVAVTALSEAVRAGHLEAVRVLLWAGAPTEPKALSNLKLLSPMYIAIANNDDNMVHLLLQQGASIYPQEAPTATYDALYQWGIHNTWDLARNRGKLDILISKGKVSPLITEMINYDCQLSQARYDRYEKNRCHDSASIKAHYKQLLNNPWDSLHALHTEETDFNHQDNSGNTALHWAIMLELYDARVLNTLIQHTNLNLQDRYGLTPLMLAIQSKETSISLICQLIEAGTDLSLKDNDGNTALHHAIKAYACGEYYLDAYDNPIIAQLLLHGADMNTQNNNGETPLTWSGVLTRCNPSCEADDNESGYSYPIMNEAKEAINQNPPITQEESLDNTVIPTTEAIWIMSLPWGLSRYPVNLRLRCSDGETVAEKSTRVTRFLAEINQHIDMINEPQWSITASEALLNASYHGDIATVQRLLDAGVSPNIFPYSLNALTLAVKNQHTAVARLLLDRHADPAPLGRIPYQRFEDVPLYHALNSGNDELIALLLEKGACGQSYPDPSYTPYLYGCSIEDALHLAIKKQKLNLVIEKAKLSPLMLAIIAYAYEKARLNATAKKPAVEVLIHEADANIAQVQAGAASTADASELTKIVSRIRLLIQESTDLNHADSSGNTALDWAKRVDLTEPDIIEGLTIRTILNDSESSMSTSATTAHTVPVASFGHSLSGSLFNDLHRMLSDDSKPSIGCSSLM